jgi:hypothetical protein
MADIPPESPAEFIGMRTPIEEILIGAPGQHDRRVAAKMIGAAAHPYICKTGKLYLYRDQQ